MFTSFLLLFASLLHLNLAEVVADIDCETLKLVANKHSPAPSDLETYLDISELKDANGKFLYVPHQTYKCESIILHSYLLFSDFKLEIASYSCTYSANSCL